LQRVVVNGVPTTMLVDWSQVAVAPDPVQPDAFVALMPFAAIGTWAAWEPGTTMDLTFGAGNWSWLRMDALQWAYLSADACAHQPAPGAQQPQSLLTTDYDYGGYSGVDGAPLLPDVTVFPGTPVSYVRGLSNTFSFERWQLRTRGFLPSMLWNACPGSANVTPNFTGFLGARFTWQLQ
ncbi:MAG: hypothetical protein KAI24_19680, partial [Planctomycetes bacterium]|nr:hypothetical protein [Planctomycetota bacterium]